MPSEQNIFQPDQKLARAAYVSSFQQYEDLYKESIEKPEQFWGNIAKQFHWETPYDLSNIMSFNFDISKGPISIKWLEGASTNICYNLLDRNIKNGHGDKIAYFWYVLVFNISMVNFPRGKWKKVYRVGEKPLHRLFTHALDLSICLVLSALCKKSSAGKFRRQVLVIVFVFWCVENGRLRQTPTTADYLQRRSSSH